MKHKKYLIFLACEAVLLLAISVLSQRVNAPITSLFAFPFEQIANGLSLLAQSGRLGNGIALALLVCLSAIPSVISFAGCGGKRNIAEIIALNITSVVVFIGLYGMINPYQFYPSMLIGMDEMIPFSNGVFGVTIWSCIVACLVIRLLTLFRTGSTQSLRKYLVYAIFAVGALFVGFGLTVPVSSMVSKIGEAQTGTDSVFAVLRFVVTVIPYALNVWICITIVDLILTIEQDHTESIKSAAEKVVDRCYLSLGATVSLTAILNILQVIFMKMLSDIHTNVDVPVVSIAFALMILLVSRLLVENRTLRDDNDLFI